MVILGTAFHWAPSLLGLLRQLPGEAQARLLESSQTQTTTSSTNSETNETHKHHNASPSSHSSSSRSTEYLVHNWLEAVFAWFQVVVLWHDPLVSLCTITGILTTFLFLTYFAPSFYATIAIAFFIYNLVLVWFRHIWPEIRVPPENEEANRLDVDRWTYLHPQLMTLSELKRLINNILHIIAEHYYQDLSRMRQKEPARFCSLVCSILLATAYIGNHISGMNLLFILITLLVATPGIYLYLLPKKLQTYLIEFFLTNVINCDYCIQSFKLTKHDYNNPEAKQIGDQYWHNHPLTSRATSSIFSGRIKLAQAAEEGSKSKAPIIDQLIGYIARGPSSKVQPQETIPECSEECDHPTSCDNVESHPDTKKVQSSHTDDEEEQKSSGGSSFRASGTASDSDDEHGFVML